MGRALGTTVEISEVGEIALKFTSKLMDTVNFYVALFDEQKEEVSFIITILENEGLAYENGESSTRPLGDGLTDYVIQSRKPLLLNGDILSKMRELGIAFRALGDDTPSLSWLGVPV